MTTSTGAEWTCEAYGPEIAAVGALCYVAEPGERRCTDRQECVRTLAAERQRVYRRIQELSTTTGAAGETGAYLETVITNPNQLLGGPRNPPDTHADEERS